MHSGVPGTTSAAPVQLPPGITGRVRPVCSASSHADGATLRSTGQMAIRPARLRHMGGLRRPIMYGVHPKPLYDQRGPLLGHNAPA